MPYTAFDMIRTMQAQFDFTPEIDREPNRSKYRIVAAIQRVFARL